MNSKTRKWHRYAGVLKTVYVSPTSELYTKMESRAKPWRQYGDLKLEAQTKLTLMRTPSLVLSTSFRTNAKQAKLQVRPHVYYVTKQRRGTRKMMPKVEMNVQEQNTECDDAQTLAEFIINRAQDPICRQYATSVDYPDSKYDVDSSRALVRQPTTVDTVQNVMCRPF